MFLIILRLLFSLLLLILFETILYYRLRLSDDCLSLSLMRYLDPYGVIEVPFCVCFASE